MKHLIFVLSIFLFGFGAACSARTMPEDESQALGRLNISHIKQELSEQYTALPAEKNLIAQNACRGKGESCSFSNDCCGNLYCLGGTAGAHFCREIGENGIKENKEFQRKATLSAAKSSCEQACYDARNQCIDRQGNTEMCDPAYDACVAKCD
ncbi:hypothetical protein hmeg3_13175 [Herbaspirillum sp. meg3]|uniref:hypothetical protein n=1 Tax=Herbaspirillum sp. meg3 TaxID=2025949 RepID=UPI000B99425E|nr:hypothetical protein [Herbaspirillum sp. meg3]ASU39146.1 hypothetical protein hmeg3_13175 [Herbaspirillum sp. meg3]